MKQKILRDPRIRAVEWRDLARLTTSETVIELVLPLPWLLGSLWLAPNDPGATLDELVAYRYTVERAQDVCDLVRGLREGGKALPPPILPSLSLPSERISARIRRNSRLSTNASPSRISSSVNPTNWPTLPPGASPRLAPTRLTWCPSTHFFYMGASDSVKPT